MKRICSKLFDQPALPSRREGEVSAILYPARCGINRGTGDGYMIYDAQGKRHVELYPVSGRVDHPDNKPDVPTFSQGAAGNVDDLTRGGRSLWYNAHKASIPPLIITRRLVEQFPNVFNRGGYDICRANADDHDDYPSSLKCIPTTPTCWINPLVEADQSAMDAINRPLPRASPGLRRSRPIRDIPAFLLPDLRFPAAT
jgi:hypothetical protein